MTKVDTNRIKALIEKRGFTYEHVARSCFIKRGSLHHILGGRHNPSERVLYFLAKVLQTNVRYLTGKSKDEGAAEAA